MSINLAEKYRPNKLSECVLPSRIRSKLEKLVKRKDLGHLIFYGSAGIGKTATAQALIKELSPDDNIEVNASEDNSVDFIQKTIVRGMTTISLYGNKRIIFLDEADGLTEKAQKLLRVPMEKYSKNNSLILCFNDASKIIEPIKSRCLKLDFNIKPKEEEEVGNPVANHPSLKKVQFLWQSPDWFIKSSKKRNPKRQLTSKSVSGLVIDRKEITP
ncbi:MAG: AAA family ATPase, partial [Proteobacteria bacterium]|nr:AAA family ATPase [Pseudomonadota bacterium]